MTAGAGAAGGSREASPGAGPIGVFDSGIGGLTVLSALHRRLASESTVYLGDTARLPYGPKSPETVRRYFLEAGAFLLERGVKLIVVACNTASARALPDLAARLPVPVIGVVEPGAREAVARTRSGRIGVIGTRGTIESEAYQRAIRELRPDARIEASACPLFVALVEEGWTEGEVAELTARRYLAPLLEREVDTLVLGCTHYPHLRELLARIAGSSVALVEPAEATAAAVERRLREDGLLAQNGGRGERRYFVTDDAPRFRYMAERWMEEPVEHLEQVTLPATSGAPHESPAPGRT